MTRWFARAAFAGVLVAVLAAPAAAQTGSSCVTRGALALALAQNYGLAGAGAEELTAASALEGKGVLTVGEWQPLETCVDDAFVATVDAALQAALNAGRITGSYIAVDDLVDTMADSGPSGGGGGGVGSGGAAAGAPDAGRTRNPVISPKSP